MLVSAAAGWTLLWAAAESTRHSAERAADTAALSAAQAALHRLATQTGPAPCDAAALAARQAGARLVQCDCAPLDCSVSVQRSMPLLGSFAGALPGAAGIDSVQARSRAGPVGESGTDEAGSWRDRIGEISGIGRAVNAPKAARTANVGEIGELGRIGEISEIGGRMA
jgi:hypothetical protein